MDFSPEQWLEYAKNQAVFEQYYQTLVGYEAANVTAVSDKEEYFIKHVVDSLLGEPYIKSGARVCDVGCGNGFPSFPIALIRPDIKLTAIDATRKKIDFLDFLARTVGVRSINLHLRAEEAGKSKMRASFDVVLSRAVAHLPTLLEYCLPLVKVGGMMIAYKTPSAEEIHEAQHALKTLGGRIVGKPQFTLPPFDGEKAERTILLIEKNAATPDEYPRLQNKPRLDPL